MWTQVHIYICTHKPHTHTSTYTDAHIYMHTHAHTYTKVGKKNKRNLSNVIGLLGASEIFYSKMGN